MMKISNLLYLLFTAIVVLIITIIIFQLYKLQDYHSKFEQERYQKKDLNMYTSMEETLSRVNLEHANTSMELENRISILYNLFLDGFFEDSFENLELANSLISSNIKNAEYNLFIIDANHTITHATDKRDIGIKLSENESMEKTLMMLQLYPQRIFISPPLINLQEMKVYHYAITLLPDRKNFMEIGYSTPFSKHFQKQIQSMQFEFALNSIELFLYHQNEKFAIDLTNKTLLGIKEFNTLNMRYTQCQANNISVHNNIAVCQDGANQQDMFANYKNYGTNQGYSLLLHVRKTEKKDTIFEETQNLIIYTSLAILSAIFILLWLIQSKIVTPLGLLSSYVIRNKPITNALLLEHKDFSVLAKSINYLRRRLKKQIQHRADMLEYQKGFVANSIHELSTPLNVISINAQMLELKHPNDENIQLIIGASRQITMIKEDVAYLLINDKVAHHIESLCLCDILKERIEFFEPIFEANEKELNSTCTSSASIRISKTELILIIDNNLSNAVKYGKSSPKIEINLTEDSDTLTLSFLSSGDKILHVEHIFQRFYRESRERKGFGIGLNIVKNISNKYDIIYNVSSENGENTFTYTFKKERNL